MRTLGEIESAISEMVSRFEQDYMGRGPKAIHAHLLGDLLVVRLQGRGPFATVGRLQPVNVDKEWALPFLDYRLSRT